MNEAERKRHEEAGWQVGTVQDFLGLTDEEALYIELRVLLAKALKVRRQAAKLSQKAVAKAMKSSQSRIAKAEANDPTVSVDLLIRSLIALGANLAELGRILDLQEADFRYDSGTARRSTKRKQAKQSTKKAKKGTAKAA
ncbi:MAG TPA: helix-turn-helix transcriptional regulator [Pyrinomonadaceae bacterium]|nr:helix-turn-helix transcriptional regulator [Pyrinomonadaceae bacterium]